MSQPRLEINGAAGTGGEPGRLLASGFVGKEESFVVSLAKTPNPQPFCGKSMKKTFKKTEEAAGRRAQ